MAHMRRLGVWALAAVAVVALVAGCATETSSDDGGTSRTSAAGPATKSANTEHRPQDDVTLTKCGIDDVGFIEATGDIVNHSSKASDYFVHVEFVAGGERYAEGIAAANTLAPGQRAEWEANGVTDARPGSTCNITDVERTAS